MKVTYEFDTQSENYDPHELWLLQSSHLMWLALCQMKSQFRDWAKYRENPNISTGEVYETFLRLASENGVDPDNLV